MIDLHGLETIIAMNRNPKPPGGLNCSISLSPGSPDMARPPRRGGEITRTGEIKTEEIVKRPKKEEKK